MTDGTGSYTSPFQTLPILIGNELFPPYDHSLPVALCLTMSPFRLRSHGAITNKLIPRNRCSHKPLHVGGWPRAKQPAKWQHMHLDLDFPSIWGTEGQAGPQASVVAANHHHTRFLSHAPSHEQYCGSCGTIATSPKGINPSRKNLTFLINSQSRQEAIFILKTSGLHTKKNTI